MRYQRSGRTLQVASDQPLLVAGLDAGLEMDFSCQVGGCGTCKSRLIAGEVEMGQCCLSSEEIAAGYCLPCIALPRGPVVLDA